MFLNGNSVRGIRTRRWRRVSRFCITLSLQPCIFCEQPTCVYCVIRYFFIAANGAEYLYIILLLFRKVRSGEGKKEDLLLFISVLQTNYFANEYELLMKEKSHCFPKTFPLLQDVRRVFPCRVQCFPKNTVPYASISIVKGTLLCYPKTGFY